jgi:hypothetical protein
MLENEVLKAAEAFPLPLLAKERTAGAEEVDGAPQDDGAAVGAEEG